VQVESDGLDDYIAKLRSMQASKRARQEALQLAADSIFQSLLAMPEQPRRASLQPDRRSDNLRAMLGRQRSSASGLALEGEGKGEREGEEGDLGGSVRAKLKAQDAQRVAKGEEERRERHEHRRNGRLPKSEVLRCVVRQDSHTDQLYSSVAFNVAAEVNAER
jgi:hypothetical protein